MKKWLFVYALLAAPALFSQDAAVEQASDSTNWAIILNISIVIICGLFAVFLLLGLREIRKTFIPK